MRKLILTLALSLTSVFAANHASYVCTDGVDFHSSTTINVDTHEQSVNMVVNGEEEGPFSFGNIDYFAAQMIRVNFTNQKSAEKQNLVIDFSVEPFEGTLNGGADKLECYLF
jgi:hypothetical protein